MSQFVVIKSSRININLFLAAFFSNRSGTLDDRLIASHYNKNKSTFILTNTCEKAIDKIKAKLAKATMLVHPKPDTHY